VKFKTLKIRDSSLIPHPGTEGPSIYTIKYYHAPKMINVLRGVGTIRKLGGHQLGRALLDNERAVKNE